MTRYREQDSVQRPQGGHAQLSVWCDGLYKLVFFAARKCGDWDGTGHLSTDGDWSTSFPKCSVAQLFGRQEMAFRETWDVELIFDPPPSPPPLNCQTRPYLGKKPVTTFPDFQFLHAYLTRYVVSSLSSWTHEITRLIRMVAHFRCLLGSTNYGTNVTFAPVQSPWVIQIVPRLFWCIRWHVCACAPVSQVRVRPALLK